MFPSSPPKLGLTPSDLDLVGIRPPVRAIVDCAPDAAIVGSETRGAWLEGFHEAVRCLLGETYARSVLKEGIALERRLYPGADGRHIEEVAISPNT